AAENRMSAIIGRDDPILVTGSTGFLGGRVVVKLLDQGFRNIRCFARASSDMRALDALAAQYPNAIETMRGNLLSVEDYDKAALEVAVVYHLAAGMGEKSFPGAFMNSVVTTRNLLDASLRVGQLKRFVNISSFAVYTNRNKPRNVLDESCPVETEPA